MSNLKFIAGKVFHVVKENLPTILVVSGTVSTVVGTVVACKETIKAQDVIAEGKDELAKIEAVHNGEVTLKEGAEYTDKDYRNDKIIAKTKMGKNLVKTYWPAGALVLGGVACILGGHGMLSKRAAGLAAAYAAVAQSYSQYRKNVADRFGDAVDQQLINGAKTVLLSEDVINEETGEVIGQETSEVEELHPDASAAYARFCAETTEAYKGDPRYDLNYLKVAQQEMTRKLRTSLEGVVTLYEVQTRLGLKHTDDAMVLGWMRDGDGDGFVDFGVFDPTTGEPRPGMGIGWDMHPANYNGINLHFNFDGIIYGKLKARKKLHVA